MIRKLDPGVQLRDFLGLVMQYLYIVRGESEYLDIEKIARDEIPEEEEYMGTIAEMLERKGKDEGVLIGVQQGKIENAQEMLLDALVERFGTVNQSLVEKIKSVQSVDTLKVLFRQCFKIDSLEGFEEQIHRATK